MLAVPGQNPMGNVLHLILGPESDIISDIHGAVIMDVTEAVNTFNKDNRVFISISKCRNEMLTGTAMNSAGIKFISATTQQPSEKQVEGASAEEQNPTAALPPILALKDGKCTYCSATTKLLPIPGLSICPVCAKIELEIKKKPRKADKDAKAEL